MSLSAKLCNRLIFNRIRSPIDAILKKNQAGFRTDRSCIQQIHILRRTMDGAFSQNISLFITFVDFRKELDSIDPDMMFAILQDYGIPDMIVSANRVLYDQSINSKSGLHSRTAIRTICLYVCHFKGVLQADVLAPFLFIIVIDYVYKRFTGNFTHKGKTRTIVEDQFVVLHLYPTTK